MRRRAEEEANTLREAASNAARRLTEEAERHAVQVRAEAERDASERTTDATERTTDANRRVDKLQSAESKLRQRLYALEMMLQSMRQELESDDNNGSGVVDATKPPKAEPGLVSSAPVSKASPPKPPKEGGDKGLLDGDLDLDDADDREPLGGTKRRSSNN